MEDHDKKYEITFTGISAVTINGICDSYGYSPKGLLGLALAIFEKAVTVKRLGGSLVLHHRDGKQEEILF